jgi:hypothetical protein
MAGGQRGCARRRCDAAAAAPGNDQDCHAGAGGLVIEEIERYNVLADEIRKLSGKVETASQQPLVQAQISQLFKRQDEHKRYILEALQAQEHYSKKAIDEILKKLDALAQQLIIDRIAAASHIRSKTLGLSRKRKRKSK